MMNFQQRIQKLKNNKKPDENIIIKNIVVVMKEFGWTIDEVVQIPLPSYFIIIEELDKITKEENKSIKGNKRLNNG